MIVHLFNYKYKCGVDCSPPYLKFEGFFAEKTVNES